MQEEPEIRAELLEQSSAFPSRIVQAEKAPRESERKWLLLKNPCDVVFNLDRDGTILFINPTLPGYTIEETIGTTVYDFISPKQHKKTRKAIKEVFKTGEAVSFETRVFGPDGSLLRYSTHLSPVKNRDKVVCVAQVFTNITKRKKTKEEAKKYKTISDRAGYGIAVSDLKGNLTYVNDSFARMHGYKKGDELIGKNLSIFHNAEQIENVNRLNTQLIRQGNYVAGEVWHTRKDGTIFCTLMNATLIRDDKGQPQFLSYTALDITERKKAEEQLINTQERLEYILTTSPATTYTCEVGGNWAVTFISENVRNQFAYEPNQFWEDHHFWVEHIHPDDRERVLTRLSRLFEDDFHVHEYRFLHKDGSYRWVHDESRLIRDEQGKPLECIGYWTDITEGRKAEEHLKIMNAAIASSINAVAIADVEGNLTYVNNSFLKMWGYKNDKQILGKPAVEFWQMKDKASKVVEVLRNKRSWIGELTAKRKEGSTFDVQLSASSVIDENGELICMMGSFVDITERKGFVQAIRQSETKYRTLVESAGESIATINEDGVFLFMNEMGAKRLGGKPEDYVGKTMWDLFPKEIADRQAANVRELINTKQGMNEVVLTELQGQPRWYNTTLEPLRDGSGKVTAALIIARDIHEFKQSEEEIRKLTSAVEQSIDGIAISDLKQKLLYVNGAFAQMHGYKPEDMIGMPVRKLHNKEQMGEYKRRINELKTKDFWKGEIGHVRKGGTAFFTYMSVNLLKNSEGKPTEILTIVHDITKSRQRERDLNIYKEKMARVEQLASLGTFSASVAHELTQPLTVIRLSIENSLAELDTISYPSTIEEDLKRSLNEISNIISIVDKFHNFARSSSETTVVEVVLKAIAERIMDLLDESAWRAKVLLRVEGMDKLPPIYSHEKQLEQLFYSLVENALQAADGKKSRQVIISGVARNEHIELRFSDNCGGIAPENLDKIFKPFFTTKPVSEGTGLGLCVVERIVSQLNGKIRVESKLGKGSTFFVTLPIKGDGR